MIDAHILRDIQERLMDSMVDLYNNHHDSDDARALAFMLNEIYSSIEFEWFREESL